jgi:hypothetical protein
MSAGVKILRRTARTVTASGLGRLRRGSLAVLVLVVAEYAAGMYVNLYVTVPKVDHGGSLSREISNGPTILSVHAVAGLLLGLGALCVLVQAVMVTRWGITALSAAGLFALAFASVAGTSFTSTGNAAESMSMSVMTGVALLCYAANLFLLRPGIVRK